MLLNDYAGGMAPIIKSGKSSTSCSFIYFTNIVYKVFCQGWSCKLSSIHLIPLKPFNWRRLSSKEKICISYVYIVGIDSLKYKLKEMYILFLIVSILLSIFKLASLLRSLISNDTYFDRVMKMAMSLLVYASMSWWHGWRQSIKYFMNINVEVSYELHNSSSKARRCAGTGTREPQTEFDKIKIWLHENPQTRIQ